MRTPFGCAMPNDSKSSGCLMGSSITSLISLICLSHPPTISYVESGTFSTFIKETKGSTFDGNTRCKVYESLRSATRSFTLSFSTAMFLSMSTTYLPSGWTLTRTFFRPMIATISPTYEPGSCRSESSSRNKRTFELSSLRCASSRRRFCVRSRTMTSSSSILAW